MYVPENTPEAFIIDELEQPQEERPQLHIEAPRPRAPAPERSNDKVERGVCIIDISPE